MTSDVFGNLMAWGSVLDRLKALREQRKLDRHQLGLIRILRYRGNWRLLEAALDCVEDVSRPSDDLLRNVLAILADEEIHEEARVLAAAALAVVFSRQDHEIDRPGAVVTAAAVLEEMDEVLRRPAAPIFHEAVRDQRDRLQKSVPQSHVRTETKSRETVEVPQ